MLCLSGFELYSRWVPLTNLKEILQIKLSSEGNVRTDKTTLLYKGLQISYHA